MDYPDYDFYCTLVQSRKVWKGGKHNLDVIAARCDYALSNHLSPSKIFTFVNPFTLSLSAWIPAESRKD